MTYAALLLGACAFYLAMRVRVSRARRRLQALKDMHEATWP